MLLAEQGGGIGMQAPHRQKRGPSRCTLDTMCMITHGALATCLHSPFHTGLFAARF